MLSNPGHQSSKEEEELFHNIESGIIDVEAEDIVEVDVSEDTVE